MSCESISTLNQAPVVVAFVAADTPFNAVKSALACFRLGADVPSPIVIACARSEAAGLGAIVASALPVPASELQTVWPVSIGKTIFRTFAGRTADRVDVKLPAGAERLATVSLPRSIVRAGTLVAVSDLRSEKSARPTIAIGLWARFAGWKEAIGSRLAGPRDVVAAEVALAAHPDFIVLALEWRSRTIVVATTDLIAADLVGLAVLQHLRAGDPDACGPWEDPLIQRATELDLGVRLPDQIALRASIEEEKDQTVARHFRGFVEAIAARIGVGDVTVNVAGLPCQPPANSGSAQSGLL